MEMSTLHGPSLGFNRKRAESLTPDQRTLHQAARDGDVRVMKYLLDRLGLRLDRKMNQLDEDDLSPLHYAARYNFYEMVVLLTERGADVNIRGEDGLTPLHFAARYKKTRTIKVSSSREDVNIEICSDGEENKSETNSIVSPLQSPTNPPQGYYRRFRNFATQNPIGHYIHKKPMLDKGMRGDSKDSYGISPDPSIQSGLSAATSVILYLASQGADINCADDFGLVPLHYAAMRGNEVAARELVTCKGIKIEITDRQGITPLHLSAIHNYPEIAHILIFAGAKLRCVDENLATPLHRASMEGNLEVVTLLLDAADEQGGWVVVSQIVNDLDKCLNLPLHLAVDNMHIEIQKLLIEKGTEVNVARQNFNFPLHLAAVGGNVDIIQLLLDNGSLVDCLNSSQETPLHRAAEFNHAKAIEMLLEHGAKIDRRDKDNLTPLLTAASKGHVEAIRCLLECGADVTVVDKNDYSAVYLAAKENHHAALMTLLRHPGCKELLDRSDRYGNSPLHAAATKGYLTIVQTLLDQGATIDQKNEEEQTALHHAAKEGRTKVVRELLARFKQLANNEDEDSNTPLHLAAWAGHDKVTQMLIDAGVNVQARNSSQWNALDCAASRGWLKTCRTLLEINNTLIEPPQKIKNTPLHLAASRGHVAMVEFLLRRGAKVSRLNDQGKNALEIAIENRQKSVAMAIVQSSSWRESLTRCELCPVTGARKTPLRQLIKKIPEVAGKVFERCVTSNGLPPEHPMFTVTFDYTFVDDTYYIDEEDEEPTPKFTSSKESINDEIIVSSNKPIQNANVIKENHPLMIMVQSKCPKLLGHSLCTSLVLLKWLGFGRYVYYTNLFVYSIFLTFLTGYLFVIPRPDVDLILKDMTNNTTDVECITPPGIAHRFGNSAKFVIIVLSIINLLKEMFQMYQIRIRYLSAENLLEWTCYATALLLAIDCSKCDAVTGRREQWQWEIGAFSILLAWLNLVMFIRKFPFLGIYVVMFTDVFITFIKVFIVFFLLIVGFGLSFSTIFYNQDTMLNAAKTLLRTSVMMLGEFNFDEMFEADKIVFPAPSYIIFVLFLILMPIITMNLLVGLAVDDIKGVQEQAELKRLAMQVELVLDVESVLPDFLRRKTAICEYSFQPNRGRGSSFKDLVNLEEIEIAQLVTPHLKGKSDKESSKVEQQQEAILSRMSAMESAMLRLQSDNKRLSSLILAIVKDKGLPWEDEDEVLSFIDE